MAPSVPEPDRHPDEPLDLQMWLQSKIKTFPLRLPLKLRNSEEKQRHFEGDNVGGRDGLKALHGPVCNT